MAIDIKKLNHIYYPSTPFAHHALIDVDFTFEEGKIYAVVGHTGSGKSTLVQHLNGLLRPTSGEIELSLNQQTFTLTQKKNKKIKQIRKLVALVFQFPEYQLFEETVLKDVMFGPKNFKVELEQAKQIAQKCLQTVGIDSSYYNKSPFELSGGEKRRVAIAGILALNPDVLVLDEPTSGLDPQGSKMILDLFKKLNKEEHKTIILVTHDLEDVLNYADQVLVLEKGKIKGCDKVPNAFYNPQLNLKDPEVIIWSKYLLNKGVKLDIEKIRNITDFNKQVRQVGGK